jgi:hypothetical protein
VKSTKSGGKIICISVISQRWVAFPQRRDSSIGGEAAFGLTAGGSGDLL